MIEGLTLILSGEELDLELLLSHIKKIQEIEIVEIQKKGDPFGRNQIAVESSCHIHRSLRSIATTYKIADSEEWYVDFIEREYQFFNECRVDDITLWIDLYMTKGIHAYQIFTSELLSKIGRFNVSLPMDIHVMSKQEMIKFAVQNKIEYDEVDELF